jgi:hypothetical protein
MEFLYYLMKFVRIINKKRKNKIGPANAANLFCQLWLPIVYAVTYSANLGCQL